MALNTLKQRPSLDEQRKAIGIPIEKDVSPKALPLNSFTFGSLKEPGEEIIKRAINQLRSIEEDDRPGSFPEVQLTEPSVLKPVGKAIGGVAKETGKKALAAVGAPITIPANIVVGLMKDFTGGSSTENVNSIRRILALEPERGDELFIGEVIKQFGFTDESLRLPEGTIDKIGFGLDILAFGTADKAIRSLSKIATADDPVRVLSQVIKRTAKATEENLGSLVEGLKNEVTGGIISPLAKGGKEVLEIGTPTSGLVERTIEGEKELFSGFDPRTIFKEKPFNPNALGVKTQTLIEDRVFDIRKAQLDSDKFINNFIVKLSQDEREALPFIRQGFGLDAKVTPKVAKRRLDAIGKGKLFETIKNPSSKVIAFNKKLEKYYSDSHEFLKENFDNVGFVDNYVTHIWDIPKNKRIEVLNHFALNNPFVKKRTIPSLEAGIRLGLKPKTTDIAELLHIYDRYKINTVFNKRFADGLNAMVDSETGLKAIVRASDAPADWKLIDHPALNRAVMIGQTKEGGPILKVDAVKVNPEIANQVRGVFSRNIATDVPVLKQSLWALENVNAWAKKAQLSFSFFHHFALTESAFSSGIGKKAMKQWNPYKVFKAIKNRDFEIFKQMPLAKDSIDHGVVYGSLSDFQVAKVQQGFKSIERATKKIPLLGRFTKKVRQANDVWDRGLWDYYHNTLKLQAYESQSLKALKQGNKITQKRFKRDMNKAEIKAAKRQVGEFINDSFGGQNWELQRVMNDAKFRQISQWFLLSPDWTVSTIKQGFAPAKGVLQSRGASTVEKKLAGTLLTKRATSFWVKAGLYYLTMTNAMNIHNSIKHGLGPRFIWENDPGRKLDVFAGFNEDGTKRYIRFGKQFREVMEWAIKPDEKLGGKLSPAMGEIVRQISKTNPGSGFPTKFAKLDFYESLPERTKSIAAVGIPFTFRHLTNDSPKNFLNTLPTSRGMTNFKTRKLFKEAIEDGFNIERIAEVGIAALENNLDAGNLWKSSISSAKAEKTYEDKKVLDSILKELRNESDSEKQRDLWNAYRDQGVITPNMMKILKKKKKEAVSIQKQKTAVGIQ